MESRCKAYRRFAWESFSIGVRGQAIRQRRHDSQVKSFGSQAGVIEHVDNPVSRKHTTFDIQPYSWGEACSP